MGCYLGLESCIEERLNTPNIAYIIIIFVIVLDVHPSIIAIYVFYFLFRSSGRLGNQLMFNEISDR